MIGDIILLLDLSTSMEKFPKVFSNIFVSMIKAGEGSGQLDDHHYDSCFLYGVAV